MVQFRGGMIVATGNYEVPDAALGEVLEALKEHNGAVTIERGRLVLTFSFDAEIPTGFAPGLVPALPQLLAIGRAALTALGTDPDVVGLSVERIDEGD